MKLKHIGIWLFLFSQFGLAVPMPIMEPKVQIVDVCKIVLANHNKERPKSIETSFVLSASYGKLSEVYPDGNHSKDIPINGRHFDLSDKFGWLVVVLRQADLSHKNIYFMTQDSKIILLDETT